MAEIANLTVVPSQFNFLKSFQYTKMEPVWQQMEDCYNTDVKRYAHRYLAPPPGLFQSELVNNDEIASSIEDLKIPVAEGSSYPAAAKAFALGGFEPDLVPRTLKGFKSLVAEHEAVVELPASMEYLLEEATKDKRPLNTVYLDVVHNTLLKGRTPIYVDIHTNGNNEPILVQYGPEALIYWRRVGEGPDNSFFEYALLKEQVPNPKFSAVSIGGTNEYLDIYLELYLEDNVFKVKKYTENDMRSFEIEEIVPQYKGKTLDFIPLVAVGSLDNTPDVDAVPLLGISNCVIQIYSLGCMLSHAETKSAVPTMYMTGVDENDAPSVTGAGVVLVLPDYTAKVDYTKTDTSAMQHIQSRMDDYYSQAQELGASLLGSTKHGTESGEALRLRQASSTATLKSIVKNVGEGLERVLKIISEWKGINKDSVKFEPNEEFSTFALTANETVALVQAWQANALSHSTLLDNFRRAGMLQAGDTVEDELKRTEDSSEQYVEQCTGVAAGGGTAGKKKTGLDIAQNIKGPGLNKAI